MNTLEQWRQRADGALKVPWGRIWGEVLDPQWTSDFSRAGQGWVPAIDVEESAEEYFIRAEMPGLQKEDVKISLVDNVLTFSGEKKSEEKSENKRYHRLERTYGSFQRSFSLGEAVQADRITAHFKDGLLEVRIPKSEKAKPRSIDIQMG